ncbi:hypothetical protein PPACK8108_LOCUS4620 [Phakopsora pachyrhizi]|uniref:Uncharacterized protein n=1 Tax=Phakopsora pachyrhizi TaxID=170000 RepID=A0AAV0AJ97_PHAPC|nr:hypothetical protein PPACK8108_LOCUS2541 [Phakopsora pachyrhizi]CAH7669957.1 hypothetical protein PPACK8108_LOCUS4620 [Phakopsora pachyrhizi]
MRSATRRKEDKESSRTLSSPTDSELTINSVTTRPELDLRQGISTRKDLPDPRKEANTKKTVGGGATDEHSVGGGEDMINEEAEADGSLIDLQAQPAAKSEHIHPSESYSQHNIHHHPEG